MNSIKRVYHSDRSTWVGDGFPTNSMLPMQEMGNQTSPFLVMGYTGQYHFSPSHHQRGVGSHPHRGFETVTIVYEGELEHFDSKGNHGSIAKDEVQWMTAGSGLVHEEFHSPEFAQAGGLFEMVQLWVNLPANDKMTQPRYQAITRQDIPRIDMDEGAGHIRVIAGEMGGHLGPAQTFSPVNVWDGELKAQYETTLHVPEGHNTILVVLKGEVVVNESHKVQDSSMVMFAKDDIAIQLQALQDTQFLLLSGEPLNEPIQGYGPFVMNSKAEIIQAFDDFNNGKFGEIAVAHEA